MARRSLLSLAFVGLLIVLLGSAPAADAAGFPVSIGATTITGQDGKILLIFAQPEGGGQTAVSCTQITGPFFQPPEVQLKEMPQSGNPCEPGSPDAFILPGMTVITAGVYVGGSQTPDKQLTTTVDIQDVSIYVLDGLALSADTAGDSDCDRGTDSVDALHVLRNVAGLGPAPSCLAAGNLRCDDGITAVDALFILRFVANLSLNLPQACPSPFSAPELLSPEDGAVFDHIPRDMALDWDDVPGADAYLVQIDGCCLAGTDDFWLAGGLGYISQVVSDSDYEFLFAGPQPGRWRVAAINADGTPGDFSEWRGFEYTV
jgi:hypothetical protein